MPIGFRRNRALAAAVVGLALVAAACGSDDDDAEGTTAPAASEAPAAPDAPAATDAPAASDAPAATTADSAAADSTAPADDTATTTADDAGEPVTLRLGYFPNVTHAPAIIGVDDGLFQDALGTNVTLETSTFNSGTEAIEALFSDAIDARFIGPNPAINGYAKSDGEALRIVAGTTSGGASLVVQRGHHDPPTSPGKSWPRPSARQHPGRRPAGLAQGPGLRDRHQRWRRRLDPPAGERRHADHVPGRRPSTAPGCPSRGPPA